MYVKSLDRQLLNLLQQASLLFALSLGAINVGWTDENGTDNTLSDSSTEAVDQTTSSNELPAKPETTEKDTQFGIGYEARFRDQKTAPDARRTRAEHRPWAFWRDRRDSSSRWRERPDRPDRPIRPELPDRFDRPPIIERPLIPARPDLDRPTRP